MSVLTGSRFVFLVDIVHAKSLSDHDVKISLVFDRFTESNLKLKPEKCDLAT